jgi:hypothetical protein
MTQRARWTSYYEKGLVDVLTDYNLSHYDARLHGLWLKKEVAKLGIQLPSCK